MVGRSPAGPRPNRERELAGARSAAEVAQLLERWEAEDRAADLSKTLERQQVSELSRRLTAVERILEQLPAAVGQVIGKHLAQQFEAEWQRRAPSTCSGIWDGEKYL